MKINEIKHIWVKNAIFNLFELDTVKIQEILLDTKRRLNQI